MNLLEIMLLSMAFYWLFKIIDRGRSRRSPSQADECTEGDQEQVVSDQPLDIVNKTQSQWRLHHYTVGLNRCFICIQWHEDKSYTSYLLTWSEKNGPQYMPINDAARTMTPNAIADVLKMIDLAASASNHSR